MKITLYPCGSEPKEYFDCMIEPGSAKLTFRGRSGNQLKAVKIVTTVGYIIEHEPDDAIRQTLSDSAPPRCRARWDWPRPEIDGL